MAIANAPGEWKKWRYLREIVEVTRGTTKHGKSMWQCVFSKGGMYWIFESDLSKVWAGTGWDTRFEAMEEHETLSLDDEPIAVTLRKDYRRRHPHLVVYKVGDNLDYIVMAEMLRDTLHSVEKLGTRKDKMKAISELQRYLNEVLGNTEWR